MSDSYDYTSLDQWASDSLDGWESLQEALASDEEWAQYLYEAFHGSDA